MISNIFNFVKDSGVLPENTKEEWIQILSYLQDKGWLKVVWQEDEIIVVCARYRIKEFRGSKVDDLPTEEEGNILFIPFIVSKSADNLIIRKMAKEYLKEHPQVNEIIFHRLSQNYKRKRIKI